MAKALENNFFITRDKYWDFFQNLEEFSEIMTFPAENKNFLFNKFVSRINLELSTYCNRKCEYCPISIYPREQEYMSKELFEKIILELQSMNFRGGIHLNFFSESLLDKNLVEKIAYIRSQLPNCYIFFPSNGDFLTRDLLEKLFDAGLNLIIVTLQTNPGKNYIDAEKRNELKNFLNKMGLPEYFDKRTEIPSKNITLKIRLSEQNQINILCNNWKVFGNDRGGVLKDLSLQRRNFPCVNPFREISIMYDGTVTPCCNVHYDIKPIYGNLNSDSIVDVYFSKNMIDFRRKLFDFSDKVGYCEFCNMEDTAKIESKVKREEILRNIQ